MTDRLRHCLARLMAVAGAMFVFLAFAVLSAQAQITTLHNFTGPTSDGSIPMAGLTYDSSTGNYYGTTAYGGGNNLGTVFKMDSSGNVSILHNFAGGTTDGEEPQAGLVLYSGYLYGTAEYGGSYDDGIVFRVKTDGSGYEVLYSFQGNALPSPSAVILDSSGNLFGTTTNGGSCIDRPGSGCGVVFKLSPPAGEVTTWTFTELYAFTGRDIANQTYDGESPSGGVIIDSEGNLYGTADYGGAHDDGIVFELKCTASSTSGSCDTYATSDTVLYTFGAEANDADGGAPLAGLIMDAGGNLYGTTVRGGGSSNCGLDLNEKPLGCGTVFKLSPPTTGDTWTETVLHSFSGPPSDGMTPFAGLVRDSSGNLYGTTTSGGSGGCNLMGLAGCGIAFKLDQSGNETVYSFTGPPSDGAFITASLVLGANGGLYGTTTLGGSGSCAGFLGEDYGCGTVFALATSPQAAIQAIIDQVSALSLKKGQTSALLNPLQTALNLLNKGKIAGAIGSLEDFIGTVRGLYNGGKLTQAQYTEMVNAANSVIEQLQAG
ncbi:MAG TPA: choice-of-anchor tandem repeat GloVer-containing protein [Terriglobia bacterium]|nr:choice-of-anchor tandem repeat GloVer-containing protein [Terriglobia bacterium]